MVLAPDGYLYVSTGDGGSGSYNDEAVAKGIQRAELGNLSSREKAQTINCLNGKILRVFGWNGDALVSNPFYDGNKRSPQSRVWALGLRNPFRMTSDENSNLYVADVGGANKEEINVVDKGGLNLGWGKFEGMDIESSLSNINPDEGVSYNDLITQSTSYSEVSDDTQRRYTHHPPELDYGHGGDNNPRIINYSANEIAPIPIVQELSGTAITGGVVLNDFGYDGSYVFSDWSDASINIAVKSSGTDRAFDDMVQIVGNSQMGGIVNMDQDINGDLYIVSYFGKIYKLTYNETLSVPDYEFYQKADVTYYTLLGQKIPDLTYASSGVYIAEYSYQNRVERKQVLHGN
jgi:hypothetical protein